MALVAPKLVNRELCEEREEWHRERVETVVQKNLKNQQQLICVCVCVCESVDVLVGSWLCAHIHVCK